MEHAGYLKLAMNEDDLQKNQNTKKSRSITYGYMWHCPTFFPQMLFDPTNYPLRQQAVALLRFGKAPFSTRQRELHGSVPNYMEVAF